MVGVVDCGVGVGAADGIVVAVVVIVDVAHHTEKKRCQQNLVGRAQWQISELLFARGPCPALTYQHWLFYIHTCS